MVDEAAKDETQAYKELCASLEKQAETLGTRGELERAFELLSQAEDICRNMQDSAALRAGLANHSDLLFQWGDIARAIGVCRKEEESWREFSYAPGLKACLVKQAVMLRGQLDLDAALLKEEERIYAALGNPEGLAFSHLRRVEDLTRRPAVLTPEQWEKARNFLREADKVLQDHHLDPQGKTVQPLLDQLWLKLFGEARVKKSGTSGTLFGAFGEQP